jgi:hypothetical protein
VNVNCGSLHATCAPAAASWSKYFSLVSRFDWSRITRTSIPAAAFAFKRSRIPPYPIR